MSQHTYLSLLDRLNDVQREAVETIEGPVMLVAGPGTGKTHVLAMRIAHILHTTDTPPYAILALTFTESAAMNMRERVVKLIGKDGYYVNIMTFHAFCTDVLKSHPEYFPIDRQSEPLSELEKYEIVQGIIDSQPFTALKLVTSPHFYVKDCIQAISHLKREGVSPVEYARMVESEYTDGKQDEKLTKAARSALEKKYEKNTELVILYREYQKQLRARRRYDFDDMIALVVDAFEAHEGLLLEYQEKLHYFLVDEYQDTNTSQNHVVEKLARYWGDKANLFVVGDPHQSIYRFQGASIENTLEFVKKFPEARVLTLQTGYRCPQLIYDAAYELISHNTLTVDTHAAELDTALSTPLKRIDARDDEPIVYGRFPSRTVELIYIAQEIQRLHESDVSFEDIALLYRQNSDAVDIQHVLEKWGIPYEIEGGENILQADMIRQLLQFLRVLIDVRAGAEDEKLFEIMAYAWTPISPILAMKIAQSAGKAKETIVSLVGKGFDEFQKYYSRSDVTPLEFHEAEVFIQSLFTLALEDMQYVFTEWFERCIQQTGYLEYCMHQENKIELLTNLNSLFREIKARVQDDHNLKLVDFVTSIDVMLDHGMNIYAEDLNIRAGAVHLSTVHKAKGREWKHVFLVHCQDGKWGNTRHREMIPLASGLLHSTDVSKKERNEDERRLFYVALTRAIERLYISTSETVVQNNYTKHTIPCMFIDELGSERKTDVSADVVTTDSVAYLEKLLQPPVSPLVHLSDRAFFADLVKNFSLSVTALNTYLRDVDEFVHNSLLKVPRAKPVPMAFGTAVHFALEQYNKARLENAAYGRDDLIRDFTRALDRESIRDADRDVHAQRGADILGAYFDQYHASDPRPLFVERFYGYGLRKTMLDDIALVGRVDRIDLVDPATKSIRVIDYKTGNTRTMGEIFGTTQSSQLSPREQALPEGIRGSYKRQLVFYKLLAELDTTSSYVAVEGMFDFVEPDKTSGKYVRRICGLVDDDVKDLKELIREVMAEIRGLTFLKG